MLGIESGSAAALIGADAGVVVHELNGAGVPSGGAGVIVPVPLLAAELTTATGMAVGNVAKMLVLVVVGVVVTPVALVPAIGGVGTTTVFALVALITEGDCSTVAGEQLMFVPGNVGSCANGVGARVVAGAPGTVADENTLENGLGPVSGDDTIAPGVVGIPSEVVPMVDTCAHALLACSSMAAVTQTIVRM